MATGVIFFVVLSILVLVHELGHFMAARLFGIEVEEFAHNFRKASEEKEIKKWQTEKLKEYYDQLLKILHAADF